MANRKRKIKADNDWQEPDADLSEFGSLKWFAYGEIFVIFGLIFVFNSVYFEKVYQDFPKEWNSSTPIQMAIFCAPIFLFFELIILVFRWMIATCHEFEMWKQWLKHPFTSVEKKAVFFGLPVILGILPAFPNHIIFTAGFMTIYSLVNCWTQWLSDDHFRCALQKTRESQMHKAKSEVLAAMEHYWLKRPQLGRIITVMFFSFVAFGLALAGKTQQEPQKSYFQLSAYAVLILVLFFSEVVIAWWRYKLDPSIKQIIEAAEKHAHGVK